LFLPEGQQPSLSHEFVLHIYGTDPSNPPFVPVVTLPPRHHGALAGGESAAPLLRGFGVRA
jgi:hypothetical protein